MNKYFITVKDWLMGDLLNRVMLFSETIEEVKFHAQVLLFNQTQIDKRIVMADEVIIEDSENEIAKGNITYNGEIRWES